jgi:hypothetical protein
MRTAVESSKSAYVMSGVEARVPVQAMEDAQTHGMTDDHTLPRPRLRLRAILMLIKYTNNHHLT